MLLAVLCEPSYSFFLSLPCFCPSLCPFPSFCPSISPCHSPCPCAPIPLNFPFFLSLHFFVKFSTPCFVSDHPSLPVPLCISFFPFLLLLYFIFPLPVLLTVPFPPLYFFLFFSLLVLVKWEIFALVNKALERPMQWPG